MSLYPVGLHHFLVLGTTLFCIGMYGALARRNAIGVLLSIELMLNGVNVLMVAFARFVNTSQDFAGQLFAIFIMTVAAAEAAVGLAIVIHVHRLRHTVAVDHLDLMKG
jgi:NAD(P)H-quinone oxidoreductase subunit 4L